MSHGQSFVLAPHGVDQYLYTVQDLFEHLGERLPHKFGDKISTNHELNSETLNNILQGEVKNAENKRRELDGSTK